MLLGAEWTAAVQWCLHPAPVPPEGQACAQGPRACTHRQDGAVSLHEVSQLLQQVATAQRIQPAPWGAPLEGSLGCLHGLIHVRLRDQNNRDTCQGGAAAPCHH